jgi:hypothetical protein
MVQASPPIVASPAPSLKPGVRRLSEVFVLIPFILLLLAAPSAAGAGNSFVLPSGVKVHIVEAPFQSRAWRVEGCGPKDKVCRIDGHLPTGTPFGLPRAYVESISIEYGGRTHNLDSSQMYDAWGARPLERPGVVRYFGGKCIDANNCQFRGLFSDGAGAFVAEWRIVNGLSVRTVLTDSSDVVDLFAKHIDPPETE